MPGTEPAPAGSRGHQQAAPGTQIFQCRTEVSDGGDFGPLPKAAVCVDTREPPLRHSMVYTNAVPAGDRLD